MLKTAFYAMFPARRKRGRWLLFFGPGGRAEAAPLRALLSASRAGLRALSRSEWPSAGAQKSGKALKSSAFPDAEARNLLFPLALCQAYSKRICLWDLAQSICIVFIIQIVWAI